MDIDNITSINNIIITKKTCRQIHLIVVFFLVISCEIFPKRKSYFFIPESFALN